MLSTTLYRFRTFAHEHDDVPAFHAAYLVATVLAAAVLNLGFFGLLILAHMSLDTLKYREIHGFSLTQTVRAVFLESITDIALFLTALTFSVYLSHTFMLAALSGIVRSQLTVLKALGTLIPKIQILERIMNLLFSLHIYVQSVHHGMFGRMTRMEKCSIAVSFICIALLIASLTFYSGDTNDLFSVFKRELIPTL